MIKKTLFLLVGLVLFLPHTVFARQFVTDWYIKSFDSEIVVNKDSGLTITENILADCGNAPSKHGIFRVLPLQAQKTAAEIIKSPVKLISITDFNNKPYKYQETINTTDHTISWKIGDPNVTVRGENGYRITYQVKNAIRFDNANFDELYWNLNGNFWKLETDEFSARILFPVGAEQANTQVNLYNGEFGQKDEGLASYIWNGAVLNVKSNRTLLAGEGITISVTMPKNIFTPYTLTAEEEKLYKTTSLSDLKGLYLFLKTLAIVWPIIVFAICYLLWSKFGRDPKIHRAVAPEFDVPEKLTAIQLGMLDSNGKLKGHFISATIVSLAVQKYISIEHIGKTNIFSSEDYKLKNLRNPMVMNLSEKVVFDKLFTEGQEEVFISKLRNSFYVHLPEISKFVNDGLKGQDLLKTTGSGIQVGLFVVAFLSIFSIFPFGFLFPWLAAGVAAGGIIMIVFAIIMPSRTQKGAELEMRIRGFRMYMETAEKYRQQFNEKENIFEKLLPYAMIFGLTTKWIEAMKNIYGEQYFNSYQPAWFYGGVMTGGNFNIDSFASTLESMSSSMASTIGSSPSSSGSGGGGFSGGGGGGGGGGGW